MSRDFELGRNVICEELTISPAQGYFLLCFFAYYLYSDDVVEDYLAVGLKA